MPPRVSLNLVASGCDGNGSADPTGSAAGSHTKAVFVIVFENEAADSVYDNSSAPYLNSLISQYAYATAFSDPLPDALPSEPHYVWMEAGTNAFSDTTFITDDDPSASNSTASTAHLVSQMDAANPPVSWLSFQEGSDSSTGACPISSSAFSPPARPVVFFQDLVGRTPSPTASLCAAHHRAYTSSSFGRSQPGNGGAVQLHHAQPLQRHARRLRLPELGRDRRRRRLVVDEPPAADQYVNTNSGVIFLVWDEPEGGAR